MLRFYICLSLLSQSGSRWPQGGSFWWLWDRKPTRPYSPGLLNLGSNHIGLLLVWHSTTKVFKILSKTLKSTNFQDGWLVLRKVNTKFVKKIIPNFKFFKLEPHTTKHEGNRIFLLWLIFFMFALLTWDIFFYHHERLFQGI